ncbi:hypothetical protein [Oleispirillum naphthae]|uniref:hypothetical protein n=1 Tax=Oleispirillum naphthae TaxID=2838853 RepID=UPI0030825CDB
MAKAANILTVLSMAALGLGVDVRTVAQAGPKVTTAVIASLLALGDLLWNFHPAKSRASAEVLSPQGSSIDVAKIVRCFKSRVCSQVFMLAGLSAAMGAELTVWFFARSAISLRPMQQGGDCRIAAKNELWGRGD